jgi:signal transduction histidine kinase
MNYEKFLGHVHPDDREYVHDEWNAALQGDTYDVEHRIITNNQERWVREIAEIEFNEQGKAISGFGTVQDITDLKKAEQVKDEFIGLVSHELRTPLTIIIGSLKSALSEGVSAKDTRELLENASEGAESLADILENMLELSRYQANRLQLELTQVAIPAITVSVLEKLKEHGITQKTTTDFPEGLPKVKADPIRVERILYNLLENAAKYSPAESEIKISCRIDGDNVITTISDKGEGIAAEDRNKLFELFQRLDNPTRTSGIGLGLVVCKRLVEAQGGWINVTSQRGEGSEFFFALPVYRE